MTPETEESVSPEPPAAAVRQRQKRLQVARACDACRLHRIKCDNNLPCSNCRQKGRQCTNSDAAKIPAQSQARREIGRLRAKVQELEQELERVKIAGQDQPPPPAKEHLPFTPSSLPVSHSSPAAGSAGPRDPSDMRKKSWGGIHIRTARSPHKTWYGPSSLFYFIKRITTFLSFALHQSHCEDTLVSSTGPNKLLHSPSENDGDGRLMAPAGAPASTDRYLTPMQEEYFLDFFWQSYHTSLFPIIDEAEFKEHYQSLWKTSTGSRSPSALVDIVIAMCMQYGISMLPPNQQGLFMEHNDAAIAGRSYYRRCQTLLAYELESPTMSTLQCHLLCCVYLCSGSFQNMADSACSLAVRAAYMLGLHVDAPDGMPLREKELRKRLWWALFNLDSKVGMKLGRPFLVHDSTTMPRMPGDDIETAMQSGSTFAPLGHNVTWLSFHLHMTRLFQTVRVAYKAFYEKELNLYDGQTVWDNFQVLDAYAELLAPHTEALDRWVDALPTELQTQRQDGGKPFSTDGTGLEVEQFAPLWIQRQRVILELTYHTLALNLYRPFISFIFTPTPTLAEETAIRCVSHAIALTKITHQALSSTKILDGWQEAFQWQWNAALTLVGFALAYPLSAATPATRDAMNTAVAAFDIFGTTFAVAVGAGNIMRDLAAKVDYLLCQQVPPSTKASILAAASISVKEGGDGGGGNSSEQQQGPSPAFQHSSEGSMAAGSGLVDYNETAMTNPVDGIFGFDDVAAGPYQEVFDMAVAVDLWNNFDMLWGNTGAVPGGPDFLPSVQQ